MSDETELTAAMEVIRSVMRELRPDPSKERKAAYTQETHNAFMALHAANQANCAALVKAIGDLRKQTKALEAREDAFKGAHQRAQAYAKGDFVTRSGSLWCALKEVPSGKLPGSEPEFWQLAAKGTG